MVYARLWQCKLRGALRHVTPGCLFFCKHYDSLFGAWEIKKKTYAFIVCFQGTNRVYLAHASARCSRRYSLLKPVYSGVNCPRRYRPPTWLLTHKYMKLLPFIWGLVKQIYNVMADKLKDSSKRLVIRIFTLLFSSSASYRLRIHEYESGFRGSRQHAFLMGKLMRNDKNHFYACWVVSVTEDNVMLLWDFVNQSWNCSNLPIWICSS